MHCLPLTSTRYSSGSVKDSIRLPRDSMHASTDVSDIGNVGSVVVAASIMSAGVSVEDEVGISGIADDVIPSVSDKTSIHTDVVCLADEYSTTTWDASTDVSDIGNASSVAASVTSAGVSVEDEVEISDIADDNKKTTTKKNNKDIYNAQIRRGSKCAVSGQY